MVVVIVVLFLIIFHYESNFSSLSYLVSFSIVFYLGIYVYLILMVPSGGLEMGCELMGWVVELYVFYFLGVRGFGVVVFWGLCVYIGSY